LVSQVVLLDTGPLGLVTNPRRSPPSVACAQWLQALVAHGIRVIVPEIADYEVRRELLRARKERGLARLDALASRLEYLPLTTAAIRQAAVFWAQARQQGQPTADDKALDGDVILAAQAMTLEVADVVIATTNVGHLSRFAPAALWPELTTV
jgi:predicted nucleic acid-binding protein